MLSQKVPQSYLEPTAEKNYFVSICHREKKNDKNTQALISSLSSNECQSQFLLIAPGAVPTKQMTGCII